MNRAAHVAGSLLLAAMVMPSPAAPPAPAAPPPGAPSAPTAPPSRVPPPPVLSGTAPEWSASLQSRLSALDPAHPEAYLLLAEEVEDRARKPEDRTLARQLYGLAGALAPSKYGRSAALALANLAEGPEERDRLLRVARALESANAGAARGAAAPAHPRVAAARTPPSNAVRLAQALAAYRRGDSSRARELLSQPDVSALLDRYGQHLEGGADGFRNAITLQRGKPLEDSARVKMMMFLEEALLSGPDRWSQDLLLNLGEPLASCDPEKPGPELGVDPAKAHWKNGAWAE